MSDSRVAPSDTQRDALGFTPTSEQVDEHTAGEAQVSTGDPADLAAVERDRQATAELQRQVDEAVLDQTRYGGISIPRPEDYVAGPANADYDPEKAAARDAARAVPIGQSIPNLVLWVNRDPSRAQALILVESQRANPRQQLIDIVSKWVGTSGAHVRAARDAEAAETAEREKLMREDFVNRVKEGSL